MRKTIKYKGVDVVYSHIGSGQPIVLLHGFLEERSMWDDYSKKLSSQFEVIAVDLLGQGETGNIGYQHSIEDHAAAVAEVIRAENVEKCHVVGHSMGGYVALELAAKKPELVAGLVLFHSTAMPDSEDRRTDRERTINLVQRNKRIYVQAVIPSLFAERTRDDHQVEIKKLIDTATDFSDQGIIANIRGMMNREDRTKTLKNGTFPKMVIHGMLDSVISTDDILAQSSKCRNLQLELIENIGHMGHLEANDVCLQLITDFCKN